MIEATDIPDYLREVQKRNPQVVHTHLAQGDEFSTHPYPTSTSYRVDDPAVHETFGHMDDFSAFLLEVNMRLQDEQVLNRLFPPGKKVCDLSEAIRRKTGMCLEKAAVVTLRTQNWYTSLLLKGLLDAPGYGRTFHAFNILVPPSGVLLADAQNPIIAVTGNRKITYPFCFPLRGYDETEKRFIFEDPYEHNIRWTYHLPLNIETD